LVRRVCSLIKKKKIKLKLLKKAFNFNIKSTVSKYSKDEIIVILEDLMYLKLIKGIIWKNDFLVLDSKEPFPLITKIYDDSIYK
jgi:hypothetical protein